MRLPRRGIVENLADDPVPLQKWFAPLGKKFSHWNMSILRPAKRIEYDVHANWKLMFENYSECYHCPGVHPPNLEWVTAPVANVCTRVAVEMCAASGRLVVAGWEASGRVTAVTEVSCSCGPPASSRPHES